MSEKPNCVRIIQGPSGYGKTSLMRELVAADLNAGDVAFVHDPDHQFESFLPWYDDANAWKLAQRAAKESGAPISRGAAIGVVEEEPFTQLGLAASKVCTNRAVSLFYDEACLVEGAQPNYVSPPFRELIARRRHHGIKLSVICQDLGMLHKYWQTQATDYFLFAVWDQERIKQLARRNNWDQAQLAPLLALTPHKYVHLKPGIPLQHQAQYGAA